MNSSLLKALYKLHLITPRGVVRLLYSLYCEGVTVMAILRFASKYYPTNTAIVSDGKRLNYSELYHHALQLSHLLYNKYGVRKGDNVGIYCRNHLLSTLLIPAVSRLGANIKLLNTDIPSERLENILEKGNFKLFISDGSSLLNELSEYVNVKEIHLPHIFRGGLISIYTGGSSGNFNETRRNTGIHQFLPPLFALLSDIGIHQYNSILIALPFYHGFGLASLIVSMVMGKKICLNESFAIDKVLQIIKDEKIEVLPVVPAILSRMWKNPSSKKCVESVKCIISGGDSLSRQLIKQTEEQCGKILYNLFGTTEAGFFLLASPDDLGRYEEVTIGRPIKGVKCEIRNADSNGVGCLWVSSSWAMNDRKSTWQNTNDLVYRNAEGFYFHRGRADRMIVCGGENVYPEHVVSVINSHPEVVDSIVYPIPDEKFGQVLNAQVELSPKSTMNSDTLKEWLKPQLARAEMPHNISFGPIKILSTGKKVIEKYES